MKAEQVERVAVLGAGTMGAGIAGEMARAGCRVTLTDVSEEILRQGHQRMQVALRALVGAGLLSARHAAEAAERVVTDLSLERACAEADLVVEAVAENMALKEELFGRVEQICPPATVLASNTSGLSITRIAAATQRPGQVAGMHFWNPPHIVPLVEVTRGEKTREDTAALLLDLCTRIGKRPILVRHDVPGFVGNRLQFAVFREALHILSEGIASPADIDTAMTAGPGLRYGLLGPLATADLGGLDVFQAISQYLFRELSDNQEPPAVLAELVARGRLGAKSGAGFYEYSTEDIKGILARRDRVLLQFLAALEET